MTKSTRTLLSIAAAAAAGALGLFWSGNITPSISGVVTKAHAVIGRPLTPMSYAGAARRTVRRAPYVAAPVVVAPVVVTPACARVVNAYGQLVTVCR